jgi:hypothetical protein
VLSDADGSFRGAGVRNIKYFPQQGTSGNSSNDAVLFRYADVLLMKAEAETRLTGNSGSTLLTADAVSLVNQLRTRAYGGSVAHNWVVGTPTLDNLLAERARELSWEMCRRDDLIRYEVASGTPYWSAARNPGKTQDNADGHTRIFPIPAPQISANPNLKQNLGY